MLNQFDSLIHGHVFIQGYDSILSWALGSFNAK